MARIYKLNSQVIIDGYGGRDFAINSEDAYIIIYGNEVGIRSKLSSSEIIRDKYTNVADVNGNKVGDKNDVIEYLSEIIGIHTIGQVVLADTDMGLTAWGIPKVSQDVSILHGMFTFNVPVYVWREKFNGTDRAFVNATSENGKLVVTSGSTENDVTILETYRNPRYEPNRGLLYSNSLIIPNKDAIGERRYGSFTEESGMFFLVRNGDLFGVIRTTIDGVTSDDEYAIITEGTGLDLEKGNIYDAQMQWRGVGNFKFFINKKEVLRVDYLGKRTELTMFNPANPIAFECINLGDEVSVECGCVDISTEGGKADGKTYGSISVNTPSGSIAVAGYNPPVLVVRNKRTVLGKRNTRDITALTASAYSDQKSLFRIWSTRDASAITLNNQTWTDYGDGHLEYIIYDTPDVATPMTFDTTKAELVFSCLLYTSPSPRDS